MINECSIVPIHHYISDMEYTSEISANFIQGTLRLKDNSQEIGPLRPALNTDSFEIQEIAKKISQGMISTSQLLLTTGFGLDSTLEIPVRLPALIIPGLKIMERMKNADLPPPNYILYQATDFIAQTNNLPSEKAQKSALKMEKYLREYVNKFHSSIAEHVIFRFGSEYSFQVKEDVEKIIECIRDSIQTNASLQESMAQINQYDVKKSNGQNSSETYAAANVLYSGATESYPFAPDLKSDTRIILPIGGNKEKPFFQLTAHFAALYKERKVIPMLTPIGSRPTYYPYPQLGDPLSISQFAHAMKQPLKDGPIRIDINAMIADGVTPDALSEIFLQ